jgi:hypothetical protein
MMKRTPLLFLAALILALPLAACGGAGNEAAPSNRAATTSTAPVSGGDGLWRGKFDTGTEVTLELFVDPANVPELEPFEAFRDAAGYGPVRYARVTARNVTNAPDTSRFATLTGEDGEMFNGEEITLGFICASAYRWLPQGEQPTAEAVAMYNDLFSGACVGQELAGPVIPPGETVTYYLVYGGEAQPEFDRVFMGFGQEFKR